MIGARQREEVFARMAAVVASSMLTKARVTPPVDDNAHADPRVYFESEGKVNDVDGQLQEFAKLNAANEAKLDEAWGHAPGDEPDTDGWSDALVDGLEEEGGEG